MKKRALQSFCALVLCFGISSCADGGDGAADKYNKMFSCFADRLTFGDCFCIYNKDDAKCSVNQKNPTTYTYDDDTLKPDCACKVNKENEIRSVEAYFKNKPENYGKFPEEGFKLVAGSCPDLSICPFVDYGNNKKRQFPINPGGTLYIDAQTWEKGTAIWNNNYTYYVLRGDIKRPSQESQSESDLNRVADRSEIDQRHVIFVTPNRRLPAMQMIDSSRQCELECSDESSAYCMRSSPSGTDLKFAFGLSEVTKKLLTPKFVLLTNEELRKAFAIKTDPCDRGNTILEGKTLVNLGHACTVTTTVAGAASPVLLDLEVPSILEGTLNPQVGKIELIFTDLTKAPELILHDKDLQEALGGSIRKLVASKNKAVIETIQGCIELSFDWPL